MGFRILRCVYILLSIGVLVFAPDSVNSFGVAIFIFAFGMIYDYGQAMYVAFQEKGIRLGKGLTIIGLALSIGFWIFGLMALTECIEFVNNVKDTHIDITNMAIKNNPLKFIMFNFEFKYRDFSRVVFVFPFLAFIEIMFPPERIQGNINQANQNRPAA